MSGIFSGGGTPDEPRMTPTELEELLIHIIRVPAVYSEARRFFDDDAWDLYSERHYRILLDGFFKVADTQLYANGDIPYLAVHNEVHRVMADDPMLKDAQYMINDIIGRPSDADPHIGLLYHSYKGVDEDDLNVPYGLVLLKKFLHERQVIDKVRRVLDGAGGRNPVGFELKLAQAQERAAAIEAIGHAGAVSMAESLPQLIAWIETGRGKNLIGLETGVVDLDDRMLGLRGLTVLGAMPNSGKTALCVQIAAGVARRYLANDAAVVFVSLDMDAVEIKARILSHVAKMDWVTLRQGSPGRRYQPKGPYFNEADDEQLEAARAMLTGETGRRIRVCGRQDLPGDLDAARLAALLADAKAAAGATRGLLVLDYLQLVEVPAAVQKLGDLAADKYRVRIVQDIVARTKTPANPEGDAVLVISEVRKPPDAKQGWGSLLADLMGAARTAYAADAVLLYRNMSTTEIKKVYGLGAASKDQVAQHMAQLDETGITPMIVSLVKGRDGTHRGEWPMEFLYRRSTWQQPPIVLTPPTGGMLGSSNNNGDDDDDDDDDDASPQAPRERVLAALAAVPNGETAKTIAQAAKIGAGLIQQVLEVLLDEGLIVAAQVTKPHGKGTMTHSGYKLAGSNGQPANTSPA
jgi:replicative DNA helicase